jgi:corin
LEIYKADKKQWRPACVKNWDDIQSPARVCSMLGYSSVNSSVVRNKNNNNTLPANRDPSVLWRSSQRRNKNLLREYSNCNDKANMKFVEMTCSNFGRYRTRVRRKLLRYQESFLKTVKIFLFKLLNFFLF